MLKTRKMGFFLIRSHLKYLQVSVYNMYISKEIKYVIFICEQIGKF